MGNYPTLLKRVCCVQYNLPHPPLKVTITFEWSCGVPLCQNLFPSPLCVCVYLFLKKKKKKKRSLTKIRNGSKISSQRWLEYKYTKSLFLNTLKFNYLPAKTKQKKKKKVFFLVLGQQGFFFFFFFKLEHSRQQR